MILAKSFLLLSLFMIYQSANAETVTVRFRELMMCDPIARIPGCILAPDAPGRDQMGIKNDAADEVGVVLYSSNIRVEPIEPRNITIGDSRVVVEEANERDQVTEPGQVDNQFAAATVPPSPLTGASADGQGGAAGPPQTLTPVTQVGGNGPEVRSGLIFADDSSPKAITQPQAGTGNALGDFPSKGVNPVSLNQDLDQSSGGGSNGSAIAGLRGGGSGTAPGPGAKASEPGATSEKKPPVDSEFAKLSKLVKNLGSKFFGALNASLGGALGSNTEYAQRSRKSKKGNGNGSTTTAEFDLDKLNNPNRGLATGEEFNSADGWIYQIMCKRWSDLSNEDNLGENKAGCDF